MIKPHITKLKNSDWWICSGSLISGQGKTPARAFYHWRKRHREMKVSKLEKNKGYATMEAIQNAYTAKCRDRLLRSVKPYRG